MGFARLQDAANENENADSDISKQTVADIMLPAETVFASELALDMLKRLPSSSLGRYVVLCGAKRHRHLQEGALKYE